MSIGNEHGRCFHCGDSLPPGKPLTVAIDGDEKPVCCIGCQAVAAMIAGADMTAFYRQRTDYAPQPTDVDQRVVDWFHDRDWVSTFTLETEQGTQLPLLVSGMSCAACTWVIEKFLLELASVRDVNINLSLGRVVITLTPGADPAKAIEELLKLGYSVRPWRTDERLEQMRTENRRDMRRLGVAGLGMMQVGMFAIGLHAGDIQGIDADMQQLLRGFSAPLTLFVLFYSGRTFFQNAWQHLRRGALIMDSSVALALLVATVASVWSTVTGGGDTYYDSVTMFVFFLLLARFIEKRLRDADLIALAQLEDGLPEFVSVLKDKQWQRTPRDQVAVGDIIRVAAGDAIAFDGEVVTGCSAVEESVFTGESVPRAIAPGDPIYAGTANREASIDYRVASHYRDSRLAALANDVERARAEKPAYLQLIDRLAARFVGFVLLAAVLTFIAWMLIDPSRAVWSALAVLVVACPCALSLATPAAMAGATAWLRNHGVLVRGEFGLLAAADGSEILLDKTGTLTRTELVLDRVFLAQEAERERVLSLASALQQFSSHPAAHSFHGLETAKDVGQVEVVAGAGMQGLLNSGEELRLGSDAFCRERAPAMPAAPDQRDYWIALIRGDTWLAWIGLTEALRPGADRAVRSLQESGLHVALVSGDSDARVAAIANALAVDHRAQMTPRDKLDYLQTLQREGKTVLAVGDGLNDAPLLTAADASIAVANATALARAQADFVVTDDDLNRLPMIVQAARRARAVMRQNLVWAAGYNLLGIPFAAFGFVPPWVAALGMSLSSLLVVLNALRLRRMRV